VKSFVGIQQFSMECSKQVPGHQKCSKQGFSKGLIGFSTGGAWLASEVQALAGQVCQMQGAFVWLLYS